jgi:hypothetical protein
LTDRGLLDSVTRLTVRAPLLLLAVACALAGCHASVRWDPPDAGGGGCTPSVTAGTPLRLLTRAEYARTVQDLLGTSLTPSNSFPPEALDRGLDNTAALNLATAEGVSRYLLAAEALSADALANHRARVVPCATADDACAARAIAGFGLRAYRRPLTDEERLDLLTLFAAARSATDFDTGLAWTLQSMLQAPQFLYRDEAPPASGTGASARLDAYQLATRLSYFLWATTPDDALLAAAGEGSLDTPQGLAAQTRRLLDDPRTQEGLLRYLSLWLSLGSVAGTEKSVAAYPGWSHELSAAWSTSLELYLRDVLAHEGTLRALLRTNALYTNGSMGMYGSAGPGQAFVRTEPAGTARRGLLAQPGFLAYRALPDGSSPVRRGAFVLAMACQPSPPPPSGLVITPPTASTTTTTRQRFEVHSTDPTCHGCHQYLDPPGFTFEHYDGLGQWRDTENGAPIDATGGLVTAAEPGLMAPVDGLDQLQEVLAGSAQVHDCLARGLYQFALGRELTPADSCTVAQVSERFRNSGGSFRALLEAVVETEAFQGNGVTP